MNIVKKVTSFFLLNMIFFSPSISASNVIVSPALKLTASLEAKPLKLTLGFKDLYLQITWSDSMLQGPAPAALTARTRKV